MTEPREECPTCGAIPFDNEPAAKRWAASVMGSRLAVGTPQDSRAKLAVALGVLPRPMQFQSAHEVLTLEGPSLEAAQKKATEHAEAKWPKADGWVVQVAVIEVPA